MQNGKRQNYWSKQHPEKPGWYIMATPSFMSIVSIDLLGLPNPKQEEGPVFWHGPIPSPVRFVQLGSAKIGVRGGGIGLDRGSLNG